MNINGNVKKNAKCNNCTLKLVSIAYGRAPWFRLFREPLKFGMRFLSWVYRVNPSEYEVRTLNCTGCIRFYKLTLKEKSGLFRLLNDLVNPVYNFLIRRIVTEEETSLAKAYAQGAMEGKIPPEEADRWMQGQYTGFSRH